MLEHVWSSTQKGHGDAGTNPELNTERMWSCWNKSRAKHKKDIELLDKIQISAQKGCGDAGANPELSTKRMRRCCSKSRALGWWIPDPLSGIWDPSLGQWNVSHATTLEIFEE